MAGVQNLPDDFGKALPQAAALYHPDSNWPQGLNLNHSNITATASFKRPKPIGWGEIPPYRESWEHDQATITRTFVGPFSSRKRFCDWALGWALNDGNGKIDREPPLNHTEYPWMYCIRADVIDGIGAFQNNPLIPIPLDPVIWFYDNSRVTDPIPTSIETSADHLSAKVQLTFRALPYEIRTNNDMLTMNLPESHRWTERYEVYALKTLSLAAGSLTFAEGPTDGVKGQFVPSNALQRLYPTKEVTMVWNQVPDVPEEEIKACEGKVNDALFDGPRVIQAADPDAQPPKPEIRIGGIGDGYAKGTLLCLNPEKQPIPRTITGRKSWRITYKFLYNSETWNKLPSGKDGKFYLATYDGTPNGKKLHEEENFQKLFRMPTPPVNWQ